MLITKKHILKASVNDFALSGLIINSCICRPLFAWAPPFIIFISGYGNLKFFFTKNVLYNSTFLILADNFLLAIDIARIVLAPSFFFCLVPSNLIKILSTFS